MYNVHRKGLPSSFLSVSKAKKIKKTTKAIQYFDRDIILLPKSYGKHNSVKIPRSGAARDFLSQNGLIGKIRLVSDMCEYAILDEMRSVFEKPMGSDKCFPFEILQPTGGCSKSLTIPSRSSNFEWNASSVAGKNTKMPIYILAQSDLMVK